MIAKQFANKIASIYVRIYEKDGFDEAQKYLHRVVKDDRALHKYLVPIIVEEGEKKR